MSKGLPKLVDIVNERHFRRTAQHLRAQAAPYSTEHLSTRLLYSRAKMYEAKANALRYRPSSRKGPYEL
jgi:hypothetical protein